MILRSPFARLALQVVVGMLSATVPLLAADKTTSTTIPDQWTVLFESPGTVNEIVPIPDDSPLEPLADLELKGPMPGHPLLFGDFKSEGDWASIDGILKRRAGKNTALKIGRAENFQVEGTISAPGHGGWFMLVGWDNRHGYMVYNVNTKSSGSPWLVTEFRDGAAIESTHREFRRFKWTDPQPFQLTVVDKRMTLLVGKGQEKVADSLEMQNLPKGLSANGPPADRV